jgi:hypothetical protein
MEQAMNPDHVRRLVMESARALPEPLHIDNPDVSEGFGEDGPTWIIRFSARRPANSMAWSRTRLRLVQSVRDRLLAKGDSRYPILEIVTPEEWLASHHG